MAPKSFDKKFGSNTFGSDNKVDEFKDVLQGQKPESTDSKIKMQSGQSPNSEASSSDQSSGESVGVDEEIKSLQEKLKKAENAAQESKNEALRAMADSVNLKKRLEKEQADAIKFANGKLLESFFPIIDSLELSLQHVETQEGEKADPLVEGVNLVLKQFIDALVKAGVEVVEGEGEAFDPHKQEAVGSIESPDFESNTVIKVHRKGFILGGRLIRPAMVTVAK